MSIVSGVDVDEGENAAFRLSRSGDTAAGLAVEIRIDERIDDPAVDDMFSRLARQLPSSVSFAPGASTATLALVTADDELHRGETARVTVSVRAGTGYVPDASRRRRLTSTRTTR